MPAQPRETGTRAVRAPKTGTGASVAPRRPTPPSRAPVESEAAFQARVVAVARALGYIAWHVPACVHARRMEAGWPDLALLRPGTAMRPARFCLVELKRDGERPTPAQVDALFWLRAAGIDASWYQPRDWDRLMRLLQGEEAPPASGRGEHEED